MPSDNPTNGSDSPPFRAIGFMLSSLGHAVSARFALILRPYELEPREFALLRRISVSEGATQQAIGELLGVQASRMVALIDSLERRQLLERRLSPSDRRARALYLTGSGRRLLAQASSAAADFERTITEDLSERDRAALFRTLQRIAEGLEIPPGVHGSQIHGSESEA